MQAGTHQFHLLLRRRDTALALLLKAVQYKYCFLELHRVDGTIGAARIILDDFQYAGAAKTMQYLGAVVFVTALGQIQRMAEKRAYLHWQGHQFLLGGADPDQRFMGDLHKLYLY